MLAILAAICLRQRLRVPVLFVPFAAAWHRPSLAPAFFFNDTPTTEIYTLSLHDALPISNPASTIPAEEASAPARSQALSSGNAAARESRVSFPLSAADLPPSPTKSSNLSETAEVPACNVPSRSPLPALAIAPETKLGTTSSGLGTLAP